MTASVSETTPTSALDRARNSDSALARRNPTVKLCLLFVVSATLLFVLDPVTPLVLYGLAAVGLLATRTLSVRTLLLWQLPFLGFALGIFVVNVLSRPGVVLWQAGLLRVTEEGLLIGAALALRTLVTGVLAIGFIVSTEPARLMSSLHTDAKLSIRVCCAILGGYRMLQTMGAEWATIRDAHAVRAPLGRRGAPALGVRGHGRVAFALLVGALRRGERIAQTFEHRGLGLTPRTTWKPVTLTLKDGLFVGVVLAVLTAVMLASAVTGLLAGPGALFG